MDFETILLYFLHNIDVNMLYRLFSDPKYMYIYLLIRQEYGYLGKQKQNCIYPHQLVNTCDLHLALKLFHNRDQRFCCEKENEFYCLTTLLKLHFKG